MDKKNHPLTNEILAKKFKNNFELVNYAIKLAENMIKTGRESRVKSDTQNRAMLILQEINEGKDQFDHVPENVEKKAENYSNVNPEERRGRYEDRADRSEQRGRSNRSEGSDHGSRSDRFEKSKAKYSLTEE